MKNKIFIIIVGLVASAFFACGDDTPNESPSSNSDWLIDESLVFDGGPGKDGIPSIDRPNFTTASEVNFLNNQDLVIGIVHNNVYRAYPHPILDWHEIVNDKIDDLFVSVTYCPLTGTGIGWDRTINGQVTEFGVSGLLYNSNLMPYDRLTNSTWSQQRFDCVNGELIGEKANLYTLVETSWSTWREAFPDSEVLNTNTGFNRDYRRYPYGDYRTNNSRLLFPVTDNDGTLPQKERVLGIIGSQSISVYPFDSGDEDYDLIEDSFEGRQLLIVRSKRYNFIVAFSNRSGETYTLINDEFPYILQGDEGVKYDFMGISQDGSTNLSLPKQMIGYWFSWATFYPNLDLYVE